MRSSFKTLLLLYHLLLIGNSLIFTCTIFILAATAAALTDMEGLTAALTGGRGGLGNIVVGQGRRDVLNVALSADSALP